MKNSPAPLILLALFSLPLAAQRTRPIDVSVQGFQVRPYCPPALDDMASGACMPASSVPLLGALYPLSADFNLDPGSGYVGLGTTAPGERLHVVGNQFMAGDVLFHNNNDGIVFSSAAPLFQQPQPMITMFASGFANPDRMVLSHSSAFPDYGLEYQDAGDEFVFQRNPTTPVLTIDLADHYTRIHDLSGNTAISFDGPGHALSLTNSSAISVVRLDSTDEGSLTLGVGSFGMDLRALSSGGAFLRMNEVDGGPMLIAGMSGLTLHNSNGFVTISYNRQTGTKNAVVTTENHGRRLLYNEESTEVWFTDYGSGRLEGGTARIELDPIFLETVVVDEEHPIKVFVTLTAASMPVWVEKGADHFVVHEQLEGTSDATFDYRVVAKRRGLEDARLEPFEAD